MRMQLMALGDVDAALLGELGQELREVTGAEIDVDGRAELMHEDRDKRRDKYRSSLVLHRLPEAPDGGYLLALTSAALYGGGWLFVFGHADPATRRAVVSVADMGSTDLGSPELKRRLLTESLHELGHLRGLEHCDQPSCAMSPYFALFELDQRAPGYCARCAGLLPDD